MASTPGPDVPPTRWDPCSPLSCRRMRRASALAWHPLVATQVMVASEDDQCPTLQLWDLRNQHAPLRELLGHHKVRPALPSSRAWWGGTQVQGGQKPAELPGRPSLVGGETSPGRPETRSAALAFCKTRA